MGRMEKQMMSRSMVNADEGGRMGGGQADMGTKLRKTGDRKKAEGSLMGDDEECISRGSKSLLFIGIKVNLQNFGKQIFNCNPCAIAWRAVHKLHNTPRLPLLAYSF